jgi:hypothetical protein
MRSIRFAPSNSIVFVEDASGGEPPERDSDALVHASPSCVSVGCYPEIDGETEIALGPVEEAPDGLDLVFEGAVATPTRTLVVNTVMAEELLGATVPEKTTRLRIWVDHQTWPKRVVIGWR